MRMCILVRVSERLVIKSHREREREREKERKRRKRERVFGRERKETVNAVICVRGGVSIRIQMYLLVGVSKINGVELCGDREVGRKMVYCTDTVFCDAAVELSQDADVLIHEATFAHKDSEMAFDRMHSTSTMAAQVALLAQAKKLIMTHFSPRYMPGNAVTLDDLLTFTQYPTETIDYPADFSELFYGF